MGLKIGIISCAVALAAIVVGYVALANYELGALDSAPDSPAQGNNAADALSRPLEPARVPPPRDGALEIPVTTPALREFDRVESNVLDLGNLDERPWKYRDELEVLAARSKRSRRQADTTDRGGPTIVRQSKRPLDAVTLKGDEGGPLGPTSDGRVQFLPGPGEGDAARSGSLPAPTSADLELPGPEDGIIDPDSAGPGH